MSENTESISFLKHKMAYFCVRLHSEKQKMFSQGQEENKITVSDLVVVRASFSGSHFLFWIEK